MKKTMSIEERNKARRPCPIKDCKSRIYPRTKTKDYKCPFHGIFEEKELIRKGILIESIFI